MEITTYKVNDMNFKKEMCVLVSLCMLILIGCDNNSGNHSEGNVQIIVSAAASMTDALEKIAAAYEEDHPHVDITFNFAGSGTLAHQMKEGAPVDLFISANEDWMQQMVEEELVDEIDVEEVTGNTLVVIANDDEDRDVNTIEDIDSDAFHQVAIGNPESVPAGEYTKTTLKSLGKWEEMYDSYVFAKDVRQVLTYVETGNTDIGFVYESDALMSDKVKVVARASVDDHAPIIYPAAVLEGSNHRKEALQFLEYFQSDEGQQIFEKYGFGNGGEE